MRKRMPAPSGAAGPSRAASGKKERRRADSVEALNALLAQTRAAQRRLLLLVTRLRSLEQSITEALHGVSAPAPVPPAANRGSTRTRRAGTRRPAAAPRGRPGPASAPRRATPES